MTNNFRKSDPSIGNDPGGISVKPTKKRFKTLMNWSADNNVS